MLRPALQRVAEEFPYARGRPFERDELATFIRGEFTWEARSVLPEAHDDLLVRGSPGQGNWAAVPWLAFFDPLITHSAQQGYYVVYLFDAELEHVHLSLNQGTTAVDREFGPPRARIVLSERAQTIRARLPNWAKRFSIEPIDLRSTANLPRGYEAGHAFGRSYTCAALPSEENLQDDLIALLRAYRILTQRGGLLSSDVLLEEANTTDIEEARRYAASRRLERAKGVRQAVLKHRKPICETCGLNPAAHYGLDLPPLRLPVEVHHLRPLNTLEEGERVVYKVPDDFAVLCPTCHRVAHLQDDPGDMDALREAVRFRHMTEVF